MGPQHRNIRQFQCRTFSGSFYIACPPVAPVEPDASATRRTDRSCDCTAFLPTWVVVPGLMISSDPSVEKSEGHFVWSPQWCSAAGTREPLGISPTGFRWFLDGFSMFFHQSHHHSAIENQSIDTHRIGDIPYDISRSHVNGWFYIYPLSVNICYIHH